MRLNEYNVKVRPRLFGELVGTAQKVDNERMHQLQIKDDSVRVDAHPVTGCSITPDMREINDNSPLSTEANE